MKLIPVSVAAAAMVTCLFSLGGDSNIDAYTAKLQGAKALTVTFKLSDNGAPVDATLEYSSPNRLRIETPDMLAVSDGTTLWVLNKQANSYTEEAASTRPAMADSVFAWRGFFAKEPYKDATSIEPESARKIAGVDVTAYALTLDKGRTATLYLGSADGLAHGATIHDGDKVVTMLASKVDLSTTPLDDSTFKFVAPDGSHKIEKPVVAAASYAAADAVFKQYCSGCHTGGGTKGGVNLDSYETIMAGKRGQPIVVPGDPANSLIIKMISGTPPQMPPNGMAVPADGIKAITDWIQAGAKNP